MEMLLLVSDDSKEGEEKGNEKRSDSEPLMTIKEDKVGNYDCPTYFIIKGGGTNLHESWKKGHSQAFGGRE